MVRHDADDVHPQFADAHAVEQIDQAVVGLRHEYQHLARRIPGPDLPVHPILAGDRTEALHEFPDVSLVTEIEDNSGEKAARLGVVELVRFKDVAALCEEFGRHARDDAGLVWAGQFQQERGSHRNPRTGRSARKDALAILEKMLINRKPRG